MKNILITGANGGIGSAIAKKLASKNTRLFLIYHNNKDVLDSIKQTRSSEIYLYQCDLTKEKDIKASIDEIINKFKKIDVLINAHGVPLFQQIQDTTEKDYNHIFDTNFKSIVFTIKYVAKHMISEKCGNIINISSMWGNVGASMESIYSAAKGALNMLTLSLAKELGPSNICVNAICPGLIDTKMNARLDKFAISEIIASTPLNRIGKPDDIAKIVKFLALDASFITGQIITVDGGFSL